MIPVVLCGGTGTRLWPLSRRSFPKQFLELFDESLLTKTLRRVRPLGSPWVVGAAPNRVLIDRVLNELGIPLHQAIYEAVGRNTAPAVALICHLLLLEGLGEEIVGSFHSDHLIADQGAFESAVRLAARCAEQDQVVTLGIRPDSPATGFGYLELTGEVFPLEGESGESKAQWVKAFHEKPDLATAKSYLESGNYLWNSGMFIFRVRVMAEHFACLMPELWERITQVREDRSNLDEIYATLASESLDYGIMEKLSRQVSVECDPGWSDLGSWDEVARLSEESRGLFEHDASNNFVRPYDSKIYGLVGVHDLLVVDTADALLITRRGSSEDVKELVAQLRSANQRAADEHFFEYRPWGKFEILRETPEFKSKIITVNPGHQLSYQSHQHRKEHWVIVRGHPEVVLDDNVLTPQPGEAVFIPLGAKHRIRNPTEEPVELVEVQLGTYFGEDDIERYEDDYDRA